MTVGFYNGLLQVYLVYIWLNVFILNSDRPEDDQRRLSRFQLQDLYPEGLESLIDEAKTTIGLNTYNRAFTSRCPVRGVIPGFESTDCATLWGRTFWIC